MITMPTMPTGSTGNIVIDIPSSTSSNITYTFITSSEGGDWLGDEIYVTQPTEFDSTDVVGRQIKIWMNTETDITPWWQGREITQAGTIAYSDGHYYAAENTGTCGNIQPSHVEGVVSDGGVRWRYIHSGSTVVTITSVQSSTQMTGVVKTGEYLPVLDRLIVGGTYTFKAYQWSMFGYKHEYPSLIYMYNNRLGLIYNAVGYGSWNCMSVIDDYYNFMTEEYGQQLDTSAIINNVPDNPIGQINWVISASRVFMGGWSGEYVIQGSNGLLSPTTLRLEKLSDVGGAPVGALRYRELNVFVGAERNELYSIGYDYTIDDYSPTPLTLFAQHLMDRRVRRLNALNNRDQTIYISHDTDELSLMKYISSQKVLSFGRVKSAGESIIDFATCINDAYKAGYMAVTFGEDKIKLEALALGNPTYMWDTVLVDQSGDGMSRVFRGCPHHAGQTVWIKYGDNLDLFVKRTLDSEGLPDRPLPESSQFLVGLPMISEFHTQPAFGNKAEGVQQQSLTVSLRLKESGSFYYGSSVNFDEYFKYEYTPNHQNFGEAHELITGDVSLNVPLGYAENANQGDFPYPNSTGVGINIKCDTPEPFTILSIQEIYK